MEILKPESGYLARSLFNWSSVTEQIAICLLNLAQIIFRQLESTLERSGRLSKGSLERYLRFHRCAKFLRRLCPAMQPSTQSFRVRFWASEVLAKTLVCKEDSLLTWASHWEESPVDGFEVLQLISGSPTHLIMSLITQGIYPWL